MTVPGAVRAWADLAERFGRLGLDERSLTRGRAGRAGSRVLGADRPQVGAGRSGRRGLRPGSAAATACRSWRPRCGASPSEGPDAFYEAIAAAIAAACWLSEDDLAAHRSEWVEPLRLAYRGVEVCELPPNGQGAAALIALGLYDGLEPGLHSQIEAMKLALADAYAHVADAPLPGAAARPGPPGGAPGARPARTSPLDAAPVGPAARRDDLPLRGRR